MAKSDDPSDFDESLLKNLIQQAALQIFKADFLLIATGAGFSADSGLPTYSDVAKNPIYESLDIEYGDLCRIQCLKKNPRLFYGFWGQCYNLYSSVKPHGGYKILSEWCATKQTNLDKKEDANGLAAYYLYTSNVDSHFRRAGFPDSRIHEVHGAIDKWLPVEPVESVKQNLISIPESYSFPIEPSTLEGPPPESIWRNLTGGDEKSGGFIRPRVLMFDDGFESHAQMGLDESCERYQAWEALMESTMEGSADLELVVLEIGCGTRVPSVRIECQDVIQDTAARCSGRQKPSCCSFIRINPDHEEIQHAPDDVTTISIQGKGLKVLERINEHYKRYQSS